MAPRKGEMKDAMDKMAVMTENEGVEIRLETALTKEIISKENPDEVIIAIGAKSREANDIKEYCDEKNIPYHTIGDAFKARRALNATAEAARVAREI